MKAGIFLLLTSHNSLEDPKLINKLAVKGIKKFIAYEIPTEMLKAKYGNHYDVVLEDLHQEDDLRVLDYDGHHVFYTFSLEELGKPIYHEI